MNPRTWYTLLATRLVLTAALFWILMRWLLPLTQNALLRTIMIVPVVIVTGVLMSAPYQYRTFMESNRRTERARSSLEREQLEVSACSGA
jgi:hypothetical protein